MSDMRIVKRELVVRLTTAKGSVLYEPVEPDTRLQAIADAWDAYIAISDSWVSARTGRPDEWQTLIALLDALTEEDSE